MGFKRVITISCFLLIFQLVGCQNKKNMISFYNIEISHPSDEYRIEPVEDKIITLEGTNASLPYGSSSGD